MRRFDRMKPMLGIGAALSLGACAASHNDVLVFATQTKVALDVSASPAQGVPSFTLGYKREEGVWMPLVINGQQSLLLNRPETCDPNTRKCYSVPASVLDSFKECAKSRPAEICLGGLMGHVKYVGKADQRSDTYSVFASFGGDFGASGGGKAALAQFFATGIAAQELAKRPEAARALKAEEGNAQLLSAQQEEIDRLRAQGAEAVAPAIVIAQTTTRGALACWAKDRATYAAEVQKQGGNADLVQVLQGTNETNARNAITLFVSEHSKLQAATTAICP